MNIRAVIENALRDFRDLGFPGLQTGLSNAAIDRWYEGRFGIDTVVKDLPTRTSDAPEESVDYVPIPYRPLLRLLRKSGAGPGTHLLDYGSGAGRVLLAAAFLGVDSATGLEIRADLVAAARENIAVARHVKSTSVTVYRQDATEFVVPYEIDLIHFFKPFTGATLRRALGRIEESYRQSPRELTMIFFNDEEFRQLANRADWFTLAEEGIALEHSRWPIRWGRYITSA